jgi:hypothetical protein
MLPVTRIAVEAASLDSHAVEKSARPRLTIRVYQLPEISERTIHLAEQESGRLLSGVHVDLEWVNCGGPLSAPACTLPDGTDLVVRIVRKALPQASAGSLGETAWAPDGNPAAFIFNDRIMTMWAYESSPAIIFGRILAHEITHLLVPGEDHSRGLMRARWHTKDLEASKPVDLWLTPQLIRVMEAAAWRRSSNTPTRPAPPADRLRADVTRK